MKVKIEERRPTCKQGMANVSTMVFGSLWMATPLHHNLVNESEGRCDVVTSTFTRSYRQSCGGCTSFAHLQPKSAQVFDFGLRETSTFQFINYIARKYQQERSVKKPFNVYYKTAFKPYYKSHVTFITSFSLWLMLNLIGDVSACYLGCETCLADKCCAKERCFQNSSH